MEKRMLEVMSWEEFDRARKDPLAILIPIGSIEEEGPHLPLGVDTLVAVEVAKKAALQLPVIWSDGGPNPCHTRERGEDYQGMGGSYL